MSIIRSTLGTTYGLRVYNGAGWSGHNAIQAIAYQYPIYGAQGSNGAESASPLSAGAGVYGQGGVGVYGKGITPSGDTGSIGVMATSLFVQSAGSTTLYNRSASAHIIGTSIFSGSVTVTGSLISPSITGSLRGTASYATQALSASWAPGGSSTPTFPYTGSAIISGSLVVTGSLQVGVPGINNPAINSTVGTLSRGTQTKVDWVSGWLVNSSGLTVVDWESALLNDSSGNSSIDATSRLLYDAALANSMDWESRFLYDSTGVRAIDYNTRNLIYPNGTTAAINYGTQNQISMTGSVSVTGSFTVSGSSTFRNIGPAEFTGDTKITGSLIVSGSGATIELYGNKLTLGAVGGDEGGEILLGKPITNTTLTGSGITIDSYQNKLRFFEQGGAARGVYIDLTTCAGGVGTNLAPIRNIQSTTDGTAITGTTSNTLTTSILIPANTVGVNDIIYVKTRVRKTGTAGTIVTRMYVNTSAAIGGSLVATSATNAASTLYFQYSRTLAVKSTTNTETMAGNFNVNPDDNSFSSAAVSANNINWAVDQYLIVAVANASAADTSQSSFVHLQINKA